MEWISKKRYPLSLSRSTGDARRRAGEATSWVRHCVRYFFFSFNFGHFLLICSCLSGSWFPIWFWMRHQWPHCLGDEMLCRFLDLFFFGVSWIFRPASSKSHFFLYYMLHTFLLFFWGKNAHCACLFLEYVWFVKVITLICRVSCLVFFVPIILCYKENWGFSFSCIVHIKI